MEEYIKRQGAAQAYANKFHYSVSESVVFSDNLSQVVYKRLDTDPRLIFTFTGDYVPEYKMEEALDTVLSVSLRQLHNHVLQHNKGLPFTETVQDVLMYVNDDMYDIRSFHAHGHYGGNDKLCSHEYEGVANGEDITVALYNYTNEEAERYIKDIGLTEYRSTKT